MQLGSTCISANKRWHRHLKRELASTVGAARATSLTPHNPNHRGSSSSGPSTCRLKHLSEFDQRAYSQDIDSPLHTCGTSTTYGT